MTGNDLKAIRKANGYSQDALARLLGLHRITVWRWEHNVVPIPHSIEIALTALFGSKTK